MMRRFGAVIAVLTCITGCWSPEEMNIGKIVPNFTFFVGFSDPIAPSNMYEIGSLLAADQGFVKPPPRDHGQLTGMDSDAGRRGFNWRKASTDGGAYKLLVFWEHDGSGSIRSAWVRFQNHSTDDFAEPDWLEFAKWKNVIVPKIFPNATVDVTSHPARFTSPELHQSFSEETGVDLPDSGLEN